MSRTVLLRWADARVRNRRLMDVLDVCLFAASREGERAARAPASEERARILVEAGVHHHVELVRGDNMARAYTLVDAAVRELLPSVLDVFGGAPAAADAAALRAVAPIVDGEAARHAMSLCLVVSPGLRKEVVVRERYDARASALACSSHVVCAADALLEAEPLEPPDARPRRRSSELKERARRVAWDVTYAATAAEQVLGGDAWRIYANALIRAAWCAEHEDCRASRELGRACVADRLRATPKKMLANG